MLKFEVYRALCYYYASYAGHPLFTVDHKLHMKKNGLIALIIIIALSIPALSYLLTGRGGKPDEECPHNFSEEILIEPDCETEGLARFRCSICGASEDRALPKTGHALSAKTPGTGSLRKAHCPDCGAGTISLSYKDTGVSLAAPLKSRSDKAYVSVTNSSGFKYDYVLYNQKADYADYTDYINAHGCSTCALATVLAAAEPSLAGYTPDMVIRRVESSVFGASAMKRNYGDGGANMPLSLYGMAAIFDHYGISYEGPDSDPANYEQQITDHLKNGDPVIVTISSGRSIGVSRSVHTILLLGIDSDGHVIVGDSVHKSKKRWGKNGLVKPEKITVADILGCFDTQTGWSVSRSFSGRGSLFYNGSKDTGFLLVSAGGDGE